MLEQADQLEPHLQLLCRVTFWESDTRDSSSSGKLWIFQSLSEQSFLNRHSHISNNSCRLIHWMRLWWVHQIHLRVTWTWAELYAEELTWSQKKFLFVSQLWTVDVRVLELVFVSSLISSVILLLPVCQKPSRINVASYHSGPPSSQSESKEGGGVGEN